MYKIMSYLKILNFFLLFISMLFLCVILYSNTQIDETTHQLSELKDFIGQEQAQTKNLNAAISLLSSHKNILSSVRTNFNVYSKTNFSRNRESADALSNKSLIAKNKSKSDNATNKKQPKVNDSLFSLVNVVGISGDKKTKTSINY